MTTTRQAPERIAGGAPLWKRGTFHRCCHGGGPAFGLPEEVSREATGYVGDAWGVYRSSSRHWTLIHRPTGLSVPGGFDTLAVAKAFAEFVSTTTDVNVGRWGDLGRGKRAKAFVAACRSAYRVMHLTLPRIVAIEGVEYGPAQKAAKR